jgi:hypothetical protein
MSTPSGAFWVSQFPTSVSTDDLAPGFRAKFLLFKLAMTQAGMNVSIQATLRPPERAYLMHYSWRIVKQGLSPSLVPPMAGVDIQWDHANAQIGAQEMVNGFAINNLGTAPGLNSHHIFGNAVDAAVTWSGDLAIKDLDDNDVQVAGSPRDATHPSLIGVGATYGVIHFSPPAADKNHWSTDGH